MNLQARLLADTATRAGFTLRHDAFFDTIAFDCPDADQVMASAVAAGFNLRRLDGQGVAIALDETVTRDELLRLAGILGAGRSARRRPAYRRRMRGWPRFWRRRCSTATMPSTRCCAT